METITYSTILNLEELNDWIRDMDKFVDDQIEDPKMIKI